MNILSNMEEVANVIIRPSRYFYKTTDLGPKTMHLDGRTVHRKDFEVKNPRGHNLKASIFSANDDIRLSRNVMIYLHCNSGCRV